MNLLPNGAKRLIDLRRNGHAPASWVLVSFVGRLPAVDDGFTVAAEPDVAYDWRFIRGLHVVAFAVARVPVADALRAMRNASPKRLDLWDVERQAGASVHFAFPADHATAHRQITDGRMPVEIMPWSASQNREFFA